MKNITFNEQINQFLKNKAKGNPHYAHAGPILHTHSDFQKLKQGNFFAFMLRFGTNPTLSGNCSKPLFSHYKKPYMVYFQNTQISHWKILRFTRNNETKKKFFTKHP